MFERFTDRARRVMVLAQEESRVLNRSYIGGEHVLIGLIHEGEGTAAKALADLGIRLDSVRALEAQFDQGGPTPAGHVPFTPACKKALELSLREALQLGHNYIGTEHLLLGLMRDIEGAPAKILTTLGATPELVRKAVVDLLHAYAKPPPPRFLRSPEADPTYIDAALPGVDVLLASGWVTVERIVGPIVCPDCHQVHSCARYVEVTS
jgi:ATP-dependent Clp protease ATP-binding subunit ClpA